MNKLLKFGLLIIVTTIIVAGTMTGCYSDNTKNNSKAHKRSSVSNSGNGNSDPDDRNNITTVEYDNSTIDINTDASAIEQITSRNDVKEVKFNASSEKIMIILDKKISDITETELKELYYLIQSDRAYFDKYKTVELHSSKENETKVSLIGSILPKEDKLFFKNKEVQL